MNAPRTFCPHCYMASDDHLLLEENDRQPGALHRAGQALLKRIQSLEDLHSAAIDLEGEHPLDDEEKRQAREISRLLGLYTDRLRDELAHGMEITDKWNVRRRVDQAPPSVTVRREEKILIDD